MDVAHVPCLIDDSTIVLGVLREPDSSIVICFVDRAWPLIEISVSMFAVSFLGDHCLIAFRAFIMLAFLVLACIVLLDKPLFALLNALPIGFKCHG